MNCFFQSLIWLGRVAGAMEFVSLTNHRQGVLLFKDFEDDFELELWGKLTFAFAFHTGLKLARYPI